MNAHTPGPWRVGPTAKVQGERDGYATVKAPDGRVVARCSYNGLPLDAADADARLIAAAPDYAEAFAKLCAIVGQPDDAAEVPDATVGRVAKAIVREYAAIAEAVGK